MHARVTITLGAPEKEEETIRYVREHIIPAVRKQAGFRGGYWLADRATGRGMVMTLWESPEAEQASEPMAAQARSQAMAILGGEVQGIEVYEVVAQAAGPEPRPARARATTRRPAPARAKRRRTVRTRATRRRPTRARAATRRGARAGAAKRRAPRTRARRGGRRRRA